MKVSFTKPHKQLAPYIDSFWVFESSSGIPMNDSRIVVPDGRAKIIIPYKNPLSVAIEGSPVYTKERLVFLTGIQTNPRTICSPTSETGTIGVELTPKGLYHFFNLSMYEITDRIYSFEDLFGAWGVRLQNQLGDVEDPDEKIAFLQNTFLHLLHENMENYSLLDHTIDILIQSSGMMRIQELAAETGYSKRYLDMLFKEHVGLSPKSLAGILRFQNIYQLLAQEHAAAYLNDNLYIYYYDQAHFIKEFKRFTGYTPQKYAALATEFSRAFHQR
ncbi:MAG: helix-turn-helix domain-containing protein [Anaerolineae bacterium]